MAWDRDDGPPQDETGRLWDVLTLARPAANRAAGDPGSRHQLRLCRVPNRTPSGNPSKAMSPQLITLEVVVQAWDTSGQPCLTVLLPGED